MAFCAISSAPGEGGIGIVRISGEDSFEIGKKIFKGSIPEDFDHKMLYGYIKDGEDIIDEVLISFMKAPKTYTALDTVEIYTHGGNVATGRVYRTLLKYGARAAEPGEFTKEAFLNGRIDLTEAMAVSDLVKSKTDRTYESYLKKLQGSLSKEIKSLINLTIDMLANIEAAVDYPEEDLEVMEEEELKERLIRAVDKTKDLISQSENSRILRDGINTVILGKPNVGKSSLLNLLLGRERAIVSDIPGTTRDTLEEFINVSGVPLKLIDTAGIRDTDEAVEKIGINRAKEAVKEADLLIAIFDISRDFDDEDEEILSLIQDRNSIVLFNKKDLGREFPEEIKSKFKDKAVLVTSLKEEDTLNKIYSLIFEMFIEGKLEKDQVQTMLDERETILIKKAYDNFSHALNDLKRGIKTDILTVDLEEARSSLLEITGEKIGEEVIDKIFKDFCLGK